MNTLRRRPDPGASQGRRPHGPEAARLRHGSETVDPASATRGVFHQRLGRPADELASRSD
jgi:hypothetical protein